MQRREDGKTTPSVPIYHSRQTGGGDRLVSLNLAEVYSLSGEHNQTREVLKETIPLGEALGLSQEVLLARLLYEKAPRR